MANPNLAQCQQYLKHLERSLKEIGDQHKFLHNVHSIMQANLHESISAMSQSWTKVIGLRQALHEKTEDESCQQ